MTTNLSWLMDVAQSVGMLVLGWYGYLMKKEMADAAVIHEMQANIETLNQRAALIEQKQNFAPTHQDLAAIHEKINLMFGEMRESTGTLQALTRGMDRIETHLLERKP